MELQNTNNDRSKFKKVEMPIFTSKDPDSCFFRVERYFKIHRLTDAKKMIVAAIGFEEIALVWYRWTEIVRNLPICTI